MITDTTTDDLMLELTKEGLINKTSWTLCKTVLAPTWKISWSGQNLLQFNMPSYASSLVLFPTFAHGFIITGRYLVICKEGIEIIMGNELVRFENDLCSYLHTTLPVDILASSFLKSSQDVKLTPFRNAPEVLVADLNRFLTRGDEVNEPAVHDQALADVFCSGPG